MKNSYVVYIVECADKTFYTGWTNDLKKRIYSHNHSAAGAKYTRGRRPVKLVYKESVRNRSRALQREFEIKKLSRAEKKLLFGG